MGKIRWFLIALTWLKFSFSVLSQNLVPNPSFEQAVIFPDGNSDYRYFNKTPISCWVQATSQGISYINDPVFGTGNLAWSFGEDLVARTGVAKVGIHQTIGNPYDVSDSVIDSRSYIQTKLTTSLIAGQEYHFKMYVTAIYYNGSNFPDGSAVCPISSVKNLGVYFSANRPFDFSTNKRLNVTPQLIFQNIEFYTIPRAWVEISGVYTAVGGEKYLTIGNFDYYIDVEFQNGSPSGLPMILTDCDQTQAHISIDDVSLVKAGSQNSDPLDIDLGNDTTICGNLNMTLSAPAGFDYYAWSNGSHAQSIVVTSPGTYWCKTDQDCAFCSDTITINQVDFKTIELGNDTAFCEEEVFSVSWNAGPGFTSYLWSTGETTSAISATAPGIYWVRAVYPCGTISDTIAINAIAKPPLPVVHDTTICKNASNVFLHATGQDLLWFDSVTDLQGNANAPDIQVGEEGIFSYFVSQTIGGCESDRSKLDITVISKPFFEFEDSLTMCEWEEKIIGPDRPWIYLWNDNTVYSPRSISEEGVYILNATNQCGSHGDQLKLKVDECNCFFYLPNAFTPDTEGFLNNEYQPVFDCYFERFELNIYNRWGEVVFHADNPLQAWDGTCKGRKVPDGIYMVKVVYKSVKEHKEKSIKSHVTLIR